MAQPQKVITEVFAPFQEYMNAEQDVREVSNPSPNSNKTSNFDCR